MYITPFNEVNVVKDPNFRASSHIHMQCIELMKYYLYTMFTIKLCLANNDKINTFSQYSVYCTVNADII